MTKHTPTPYSVAFKDRGHGHGDYGIISEQGELIAELRTPRQNYDAAHIVKCVNNYDVLNNLVKRVKNLDGRDVMMLELLSIVAEAKSLLKELGEV